MKTTKLILSIALVALTVTAFGNDYISAGETIESELILESWMTASFLTSEDDMVLENWMTTPFVLDAELDALAIESWMTSSFGLGTELDALVIESWMIRPFEATDDNCSGVLMAAACN